MHWCGWRGRGSIDERARKCTGLAGRGESIDERARKCTGGGGCGDV